ncbi:MAG: DUF4381 domain-containing protein [Pseudomonadota bacterium]
MTADPFSLDNLHDIVEPAAIPMWPPAAGFWIVLALLLLWCAALGLLWWMRYRKNRYRREALALLRRIEPGLHAEKDREGALGEVALLLKRAALTAYPRKEVAELAGDEWLAFLDRSGNTTGFSRGAAAVFGRISWQPQAAAELSELEVSEVVNSVKSWIKGHHTEGVD